MPNAPLVGMDDIEATLWEMEGPMILKGIDVNCEVVAATALEAIGL